MKKAQAILEMSIVFMVGLFLLFGIISMWLWANEHIVERQVRYNDTRLQAGMRMPTNILPKSEVWPVYDPKASPLTKEEVFEFQK